MIEPREVMTSQTSVTLLNPSPPDTGISPYADRLADAVHLARKMHRLRRKLATELEALGAMADEMGLGSDAAILGMLHTTTLLSRTKLVRRDLDALALSASRQV